MKMAESQIDFYIGGMDYGMVEKNGVQCDGWGGAVWQHEFQQRDILFFDGGGGYSGV